MFSIREHFFLDLYCELNVYNIAMCFMTVVDDVDHSYKFQRIAEKFPEMPLATVLAAEAKFVEADVNRDGVTHIYSIEIKPVMMFKSFR
jgi:hypothetical protein